MRHAKSPETAWSPGLPDLLPERLGRSLRRVLPGLLVRVIRYRENRTRERPRAQPIHHQILAGGHAGDSADPQLDLIVVVVVVQKRRYLDTRQLDRAVDVGLVNAPACASPGSPAISAASVMGSISVMRIFLSAAPGWRRPPQCAYPCFRPARASAPSPGGLLLRPALAALGSVSQARVRWRVPYLDVVGSATNAAPLPLVAAALRPGSACTPRTNSRRRSQAPARSARGSVNSRPGRACR